MRTIGIVTVGESPRPDIEVDFTRFLSSAKLLVTGALDGLSLEERMHLAATSRSSYPIRCRLRDGSELAVAKSVLEPLVQLKVEELQDKGAAAIVLGCTGVFPTVRADVPLLSAGKLATNIALALRGHGVLGCIVPLKDQVSAVSEGYEAEGVPAVVMNASPSDTKDTVHRAAKTLEEQGCSLIYLRCFGFGLDWQASVQSIVRVPVLAPVNVTAATALALMPDAG